MHKMYDRSLVTAIDTKDVQGTLAY